VLARKLREDVRTGATHLRLVELPADDDDAKLRRWPPGWRFLFNVGAATFCWAVLGFACVLIARWL
jgi:hypothetical protein